jgi:hypothetical protein
LILARSKLAKVAKAEIMNSLNGPAESKNGCLACLKQVADPVLDPQSAPDPLDELELRRRRTCVDDAANLPVVVTLGEHVAVAEDIREESRVEGRQRWQMALDRTEFGLAKGRDVGVMGRSHVVVRGLW